MFFAHWMIRLSIASLLSSGVAAAQLAEALAPTTPNEANALLSRTDLPPPIARAQLMRGTFRKTQSLSFGLPEGATLFSENPEELSFSEDSFGTAELTRFRGSLGNRTRTRASVQDQSIAFREFLFLNPDANVLRLNRLPPLDFSPSWRPTRDAFLFHRCRSFASDRGVIACVVSLHVPTALEPYRRLEDRSGDLTRLNGTIIGVDVYESLF